MNDVSLNEVGCEGEVALWKVLHMLQRLSCDRRDPSVLTIIAVVWFMTWSCDPTVYQSVLSVCTS